MLLDAPLGRWLPVLRTTWHMAYRTESTIYWRKLNDRSLHILTPAPTSGFYHLSGITQDLPLHSHPIAFQQVGEALWSRSPLRLGGHSTCNDLSPGHMMENTLCHPTKDIITIGSDGSVHLAEQVAACAWIGGAAPTRQLTRQTGARRPRPHSGEVRPACNAESSINSVSIGIVLLRPGSRCRKWAVSTVS